MQCHSIFSFEWNLIFTKFILFFHQLIVISNACHPSMDYKYMWPLKVYGVYNYTPKTFTQGYVSK
jgi:hypothetical protein